MKINNSMCCIENQKQRKDISAYIFSLFYKKLTLCVYVGIILDDFADNKFFKL